MNPPKWKDASLVFRFLMDYGTSRTERGCLGREEAQEEDDDEEEEEGWMANYQDV